MYYINYISVFLKELIFPTDSELYLEMWDTQRRKGKIAYVMEEIE